MGYPSLTIDGLLNSTKLNDHGFRLNHLEPQFLVGSAVGSPPCFGGRIVESYLNPHAWWSNHVFINVFHGEIILYKSLKG